MTSKELLNKLATEKNEPCVTISFNTYRTHPDNAKDDIMLKNLLKEAENRVTAEFDKKAVAHLLENIENIATEIDVNYNLDSMHLFISNDTAEIIRSPWKTSVEGVFISESFAVRSIIKSYSKSETYLLMLLSQSGVHLYEAMNDGIVKEIKNEDFPYEENPHYNGNEEKASDAKYLDNLVREYLNKVDKALIKVHNATNLDCVVICTEDNYSRLQQVANKPSVYLDYAPIEYNNTATHQIVKQSWEIIQSLQEKRTLEAIAQVQESVSSGTVITELQEIFQASIDGRADVLIVSQDFTQPVMMKDDRTFDIIEDVTLPNAIDDITSTIAWEVISKNGKVYFTPQEEIEGFGKIVLKTRY